VSVLFHTREWLTISQLARAWSSELTKGGEDQRRCEQDLVHILLEDIINGRLDDSGPLRDGRRLGLRCITPENKAGFIEGHQLLDVVGADRSVVLHNVLIMKEATLDFAKRHQLPCPSWWSESDEMPSPQANDAGRDIAPIAKASSLSVGKLPRLAKYLTEHFPEGVPEPGLCPRHALKSEILKRDPSLKPLDDATLKKAIDKYNANLPKPKT
jgi:hypothetical protein